MKTCVSFILLVFALFFQKGDAQIAWTTPSGGDGSVSVAEGAAAGDAVDTLVATSTGQAIATYTILTGGSTFSIANTGALTVTASSTLDYETAPTYVLTIQAVDDTTGTALTSTATVTVSVTNVANDPVFGATSYGICVADGTTASSSVYTIPATDPNGDSLTYTIAASGNTNTDFTIAAGGVISTANALVTATTGSYSLVIYAADAALTATVSILVSVAAVCSSATALVVSSLTILTALVVALH